MSFADNNYDMEPGIDEVPISDNEDDKKMDFKKMDYKKQGDDENSDNNNNGSVRGDKRVPVPKKRKFLFVLSYSSFLILYLVFVLVIAFTHPLKPICKIEGFYLPILESPNNTEHSLLKMEFNFVNRNLLISYRYDDFINVSIDYYYPHSREHVEFASTTIAQGFHQHKRNHKVEVQMPATGLPILLFNMKNESSSINFRVKLVFNVRFKCKGSCTRKHLLVTPNIWYEYPKPRE